MTSSPMLRSISVLLVLVLIVATTACTGRRGNRGGRDNIDLGPGGDAGGLDAGPVDGGGFDLAGFDASGFDAGSIDLGRDLGGGTGTEGDLRLSGGSSGLLEVFHAGEWGTVCNDLFDGVDSLDPEVACRQLGFATGSYVTPEVPGTGQIWMDSVACTGSESRLVDCPFDGFGVHDCSHSEDVGLICTTGAP